MSLDFYANNVRGIIDEIQGDIAKLNPSDFSALAVQTFQEKIRSAKNSIEEMEHQLIMLSSSEKQTVINRINSYKKEIQILEEKLQSGKQRAQLFGDVSSLPPAQRESFAEASNAVSESVKIGSNILASLNDQKAKILHSIDGVHDIDRITESAGSITSRMRQRQNQNNLCYRMLSIR